jgi:mRNA-degrading endonuclease RelE of RelBE toxin-antitoxin system
MTPAFTVLTSPHFERLAKAQLKRHREFSPVIDRAIRILQKDPYNQDRTQAIKKLAGAQIEGQWRLRLGRWRFRYDIAGQTVQLKYCGLRREDTYR